MHMYTNINLSDQEEDAKERMGILFQCCEKGACFVYTLNE